MNDGGGGSDSKSKVEILCSREYNSITLEVKRNIGIAFTIKVDSIAAIGAAVFNRRIVNF